MSPKFSSLHLDKEKQCARLLPHRDSNDESEEWQRRLQQLARQGSNCNSNMSDSRSGVLHTYRQDAALSSQIVCSSGGAQYTCFEDACSKLLENRNVHAWRLLPLQELLNFTSRKAPESSTAPKQRYQGFKDSMGWVGHHRTPVLILSCSCPSTWPPCLGFLSCE